MYSILPQVDHFSYTNNDTFKMKYLMNNTYWDVNKGPVFFYAGNEGPIEDFSDNTVSFYLTIIKNDDEHVNFKLKVQILLYLPTSDIFSICESCVLAPYNMMRLKLMYLLHYSIILYTKYLNNDIVDTLIFENIIFSLISYMTIFHINYTYCYLNHYCDVNV